MTTNAVNNWKCLWRWITSQNLSGQDLQNILDANNVKEALFQGLNSYKPNKPEAFAQLQSKYPEQVKLLNIVQILQNYIDVDTFQIWDLIKHYLCSISYGTLSNALKNIAFVDTRPTFLLPNIWNFYYTERLFLLRLLQYIIDNKNDASHKYHKQFCNIYNSHSKNLMSLVVEQFEKVLTVAPPSRKIQNDFGSETIQQQWAEYNLREQLALLQVILLLVEEESISVENFQTLFKAFRRHNFGKNQGHHELLEDRHREMCMQIMYLESCLFSVVCYKKHIENPHLFIEATEKLVDPELTKLQLGVELSPMLLSWMMLSLESKNHAKLFESKFQHYGSTALRMHVFEFLNQMVKSAVLTDSSKCSKINRDTIFKLLNVICDRFDTDGTISRQTGIIELCADLLSSPDIAEQFWSLHQKNEQYGVVSLWNTALEYFPYNFSMLSCLAGGLAEAGKGSVINLIGELENLPVYTEMYNPNSVPLMSSGSDDAIIGREYSPIPAYTVAVGSKATVMERREGTMIHFRTPYSYWTVFNDVIERALDRKLHHRPNETLQRVYEGIKVLKGVAGAKAGVGVPRRACEGALDVLARLGRALPLPLLAEGLRLCAALVPACPDEIHLRLAGAGVLPRLLPVPGRGEAVTGGDSVADLDLAAGFDPAAVGACLEAAGQTQAAHDLLEAYVDLLCAFYEWSREARTWREAVAPGLALAARAALVGGGARRARTAEGGARAAALLANALQRPAPSSALADAAALLRRTALHVLLYTESARDLLEVVCVGNEQLEKMMLNESSWVSGRGVEQLCALQRCAGVLMLAVRLRAMAPSPAGLAPLERLVLAQHKQADPLKVVPHVTSYINHVFNRSLPVLSCRLLKRFAEGFQISLFSSLDMSAYQVRVMFLDRLRDEHESVELKVAILEFVATCVGKQPGLTEAFFMMNHEKAKNDEKNGAEKGVVQISTVPDDSFEGILGYMADYLETIKSDAKLLQSPLLGCIMELFHALWKNNMQILVKKLRENPKFWEHMTSPLFNEIQPGLRTYAQIFNVLGIELFASRDKLDPGLKNVLEEFFDTDKKHLDKWIDFIFSFHGREDEEEAVDKVPSWLGLLTSWKDFMTIFCRSPPIGLNIAHKAKAVAPCMTALLGELEEPRDGRPLVILAELYAALLANWRDDCFEDRRASARQVARLLAAASSSAEALHPRGAKALLAVCALGVAAFDYELRASGAASECARAAARLAAMQLAAEAPDDAAAELALAALERCLAAADEAPEPARLVDELLCWLHEHVRQRERLGTSLAALRCLAACARRPHAGHLPPGELARCLWLRLLPPAMEPDGWRPRDWWRLYGHGLDLIATALLMHGHLFAGEAVTFVGVHLEHLVEAVLLPRQATDAPALALTASALGLVVQLVRFEARWRMQNVNSFVVIMRSISECLHHAVTLALRARRPLDATLGPTPGPTPASDLLHRSVELVQLSARCLLACSPPLLALLAAGADAPQRWPPLVELHFGAPKIAEPHPHLTFGTLLAAVGLLTRLLNHAYQSEEGGGSRSPRGRRRVCSCGSPGPADARRAARSESFTSMSSVCSAPVPDRRLVATALEHAATLLASQALVAVRDPGVPSRHKQLVRRELASELASFHDSVRKRLACPAHARPPLARSKLGAWPLRANADEVRLLAEARQTADTPPTPPPPKRAADSMRAHVLRKRYLDELSRSPASPPPPVSHSTPAPLPERRRAKRVSWAEPPRDLTDADADADADTPCGLTDVQIDADEDYFHFMSVVFLYICQTDL